MSYPFIHAKFDYGARKAPILGFVVHMAEGGGTVGFLARNPDRGVSVHYVIEYSGRIVRMLDESHASGSIDPTKIRTTNDADGFFGVTASIAVLGRQWARDPNAAVISLEIEGFASAGPNKAQQDALVELVNDVRTRYPGIGLLGHRDFADYKACPGRLIPWARLGGHGPAQETTDVTPAPISDQSPKIVTANAGHTWRDLDGTTVVDNNRPALVKRLSPYGTVVGHERLRAIFTTTPGHPVVYIVPATIEDAPSADCGDAVAAEHERTRQAAITAVEAIK